MTAGSRARAEDRLSFDDRWVVVTGASSGLGAAIARRLAAEGARLLLVARRTNLLAALASELRERGAREVVPLPHDLAATGATDALFDEATRGREVHSVVSSAATYWFGDYGTMPADAIDRMLALNVRVPITLVRRFLPYLAERRAGGILLVSSLGALVPSPGQALYSSTKAMLRSFVESVHHERGGKRGDVVLTASFPGGMPTEMFARSPAAERLRTRWLVRCSMMSPDRVARASLDAFRRGEPFVVPGALNRLIVGMSRLLPREIVGQRAADVYGVGRPGRLHDRLGDPDLRGA